MILIDPLSRERPDADNLQPGSEREAVLGYIPATARLDLGSERVRLFATSGRLIVAHLGKRGAGALVTSPILGKLSKGLEELLDGGRESRKGKFLEASTVEELLRAKDNFDIPYDDIVKIELEDLGGMMTIMVLTKNQKFQFVTLAKSELVVSLFRAVSDRVSLQRTRP